MGAFSDYYKETFERLQERAARYNETLALEEQALLRPFFEAMADLNEGGKMLRGVLVTLGHRMACRAASLSDGAADRPEEGNLSAGARDTADAAARDTADAAALAFEVFQTGVLIHDDVIDRAAARRGKPTMTVRYAGSLRDRQITPPAAFGSAESSRERLADSAAICAGDYLITASNLILAEACRDHLRGAEAVAAFDRVILDTIRGELLDVILPAEMQAGAGAKDGGLLEAVNDIYRLKTAQYSVTGPLELGMILGGMPADQRERVGAMADELGVAFQIKDDILGIYADEEELGKDVGSDVSEFKQTLLYAYVRLNDPAAHEKLLAYYGKPDVSKDDLSAVREIFEASGARAYAEGEMERHFGNASRLLGTMTFLDGEDREVLADFIRYNAERTK